MRILENVRHWRCWKLFLTISFVSIAAFGLGQTVTVLDSKTLEPINHVYILSADEEKAVSTRKNGTADLSEFKDEDILIFQHQSYTILSLQKKQVAEMGYKISLTEKINTLNPIEILKPLRDMTVEDDATQQLAVLSSKDIAVHNYSNAADILQSTGSVFIQKSQGGGGSPVLRGFEANKILLVIDGVRMNNAIYRSGHLQNAITLDPAVMRRTEVIFGPGSVLYGSDAIGGVIHYRTKDPDLADENGKTKFTGASFLRYGSANNEFSGHFNFSVGFKKVGFFTSFSGAKYGDIRQGKNKFGNEDPAWGRRYEYVGKVNGLDSILQNKNPLIQVGTGYSQFDIMEKVLIQANDSTRFIVNFQYSQSTDIPRYDRLTEYRDGQLRFGDWHYGPQKRIFASFKTKLLSKSKMFSTGNIIVSYQNLEESRVTRSYQSSMETNRIENVQVLGFNIDFGKKLDSARMIYYGIESYTNWVRSEAYEQNLISLERFPSQTRYPDGGSIYANICAYVAYKHQWTNKLLLNFGARFSYNFANSKFLDTNFIKLPFTQINFNTASLSGNLGIMYRPNTTWQIDAQLSAGYRAPNVDDYGKVFERGGEVVVPNDQLKPEYAFNAEFGVSKIFWTNKLKIGANFYFTYLLDAIVRQDYQLNGQDSMEYDGEMAKIQTNVNSDMAYVLGVNAYLEWRITKSFRFNGSYNYTLGRDISNNQPMSHIPPQFGRVGIGYYGKQIETEIYSYFNTFKSIDDYGPGSTDKPESAQINGTPGWATLNLRFSYNFIKNFYIQLNLENLLDQHYRPFSSGVSAPGFNARITLRYGF